MSAAPVLHPLTTGAEARSRGPAGGLAVVCANGGQAAAVPGTWSASIEWLVDGLAARFPDLRFVEVRYRVKSWKRLDWCVGGRARRDRERRSRARPARRLLDGRRRLGACRVPSVGDAAVLGLAPWLPDELDVSPLVGRRLDVLHGALDRWLPGIPGVSPSISRRGFERATRLGVEGTYRLIPGAVHGIALRSRRSGRLLALPRAARWKELAGEHVAHFRDG